MRIHKRILLSTAISLLISAVILFLVYAILWNSKQEAARADVYSEIGERTTALSLLVAGFPSQPDASRIRQIKSVHLSLEELLGQLRSSDAREESLILQIRNNAHALGETLARLFAILDEPAAAEFKETHEVLVSQLWMKAQLITDDTNRLMKISHSRIHAAQQQAALLTLGLIAALILINAAISIFSGRRILRVQSSLRSALTEAEQKSRILEAMMEHIPMGITIADSPDVTVKFLSRYWLEMTGKPWQRIENIPMEQYMQQWPLFGADGKTPVSSEELPLTRAIKRGESIEQEEWLMGKSDGSRIPILCTAAPIRNAKGVITGGVIGWQDITHRKQAEDALRQLNDSLERQVAERTKLAEARAKQLQSLAVELIDAEDRERQRISKLLHDDLQQILAAARYQVQTLHDNMPHLDELTDLEEMLSSSIAKSRRLSHELSPTILHHSGLVAALGWLARHMRERFGLEVQIQAEQCQELESTPLKVFIFRAAQELLFNVVKYAGIRHAQVILTGSDHDLSVTVSDHGKGFDPSILEQSDPKTGLGLLSLRERASYIGGRLRIESTPAEGSRITITVPVTLTAEVSKPSEPAARRASGAPSGAESAKGPQIRIMLVDDHKVMRQGLIRLIATQPDIQVVGEAGDGREALELARQLKPDVVVMDISMPEMNGIEATRHLKAEFPLVRVIGLSMFEDHQAALSMREAGAESFVSKAASAAHLLQVIYGADGRDCADPYPEDHPETSPPCS